MLIDFRVKNFRSLRDDQVLSLVASKDKTLSDTHTLRTGRSEVPSLVRSAVIYGANASGKSNVIKALQYMRNVIAESATIIQPGQTYNVQPFRLNKKTTEQATEFEVTFLFDGVRYQYGFSLTSKRIMSEHLLVYKNFKPQRWFDRHFDVDSGKDIYAFGTGLKGAKSVWEGATRDNGLFLSTAVQLNSEALRPIFDWFINKLVIINELSPPNPQSSIQMLKNPEGRKGICNFLTAADISITDIEVVTKTVAGKSIRFDLVDGGTEVKTEDIEDNQLHFHHISADGTKASFGLADESSGTRNLLFLAGPMLNILKNGMTVLFDELDNSLHTLLVRELVKLFHSPALNANGAQLIFTTHDTSLLDAPDLFRRDQIWLVEKDQDQSSTLVGLAEFNPRKNEALERGYLMGRYGGIPFISRSLGSTE